MNERPWENPSAYQISLCILCTSESYAIDPKEAASLVDENTILVCAILGSTYTREYDDFQALNDELQKKNTTENLDIHIHVDAASGGFVVPFL